MLKNNIKNDFFFGKYISATVYYYYHVKQRNEKQKKGGKIKLERKKHIRNLDRIRQMSVEELAPLLVHESYEFDVDYDWENPIETYDAVYNSPS